MKKFRRIKAYNKKYKDELEDALKIIHPYLIHAFTKYYGEKYFSKISFVISNMHYTYFISETFLLLLSKKGMGISSKDKRVAQYYIKYLNSLNLERIQDINQLEEEVLNKLIVKSSFDDEMLLYANLLELLASDFPIYTVIGDQEEKNFYKAIFLPVFVINLEVIIHEINHSLMLDAIAFTDDEVIMPSLFIYQEVEELFNHYITHLVLEHYLKEKFPVPYSFRRFDFVNEYEEYFYLIESFYFVFEQVIKRSAMTKDFNLLWEYAGKEDFCLFCSLVKEYYLQGGCAEEEFMRLEELVLKMNDHALSITREDDEFYIEELESLGYKVRKLIKKEDL